MYCPSCGSDADERQPSQYCRACGFDLRGVRQTLERPDSITDSAISARQQISLAIAEKIKEVETGDDLKEIVEEVLPQIEKFLESPEERRLRRIRAGLITGSIGFGASLGALFMTITDEDFLIFLLPTLVLFFIGVGLMINGLWFTLPRKQLPDADLNLLSPELIDKSQRQITKNISPAYPPLTNSSVTEHTTHHLRDKDVR
jgi:hypothetical protein